MNTVARSFSFFKPIELPHPRRLFSTFLSQDIGLDLGTANSVIYLKRRGIVINEPSVISVDSKTHQVLAIGKPAKEMFGRTGESVICIRPMKDGVIADCQMSSLMIARLLSQVRPSLSLHKPRLLIGVPSGITQIEKKSVIDAAIKAGAGVVYLIEEPMAAAIGAALPVDQAVANMVVDIGGGTTEVAIISSGATQYSHSIRVAGDEMDRAIQRIVRRELNLQIGIFEAEGIKIAIGSALPQGDNLKTLTSGRDLSTGMPAQHEICDSLVRTALTPAIEAIISSVCTGIEQASPELGRDIINRGIYLTGGGSLLRGLCERLHRETGIKFFTTTDPLTCVARGIGKVIENMHDMQKVCIS